MKKSEQVSVPSKETGSELVQTVQTGDIITNKNKNNLKKKKRIM